MVELLKRWFARETKASETQAIIFSTLPSTVFAPRDLLQLAREGYASCAIVYACVQTIIKAVAGLRWVLYQRQGEQWQEREDHPLLTLLRQPNPDMSWAEWAEYVVGGLMIGGSAFIERVGPGLGEQRVAMPPRELWPLRADRMTIKPGPGPSPVSAYEYRSGTQTVTLDPRLVLHVRLYHPADDLWGLSPLQVLASIVDAEVDAIAWNRTLIQRGARPSGALITQQRLSDQEIARLRAQIEDLYTGAAQAGRPLILSGGLDWKAMGLSPVDLDWQGLRKKNALDICTVYGVPPELIGVKEGTYENRREARKAFYTETVLPLADKLRDELATWLLPLYGADQRFRLDYDRDAIEPLQEDRERLWTRVRDAQWLTINEKRLATGYDELPGGDVLLVPMSQAPLQGTTGEGNDLGPSYQELTVEGDEAAGASGPQVWKRQDRRARQWVRHARALQRIERDYVASLRAWFREQAQHVVAAITKDAGGPSASKRFEVVIDWVAETDHLKRRSRRYLAQAIEVAVELTKEDLDIPLNGPLDKDLRTEYALRRLSQITDTVRRGLERVIREALDEQWTPAELAQELRQYYAGLSQWRAQTIARTELGRVYSAARIETFREADVREIEWLSARDELVRRDPFNHAIDGESVIMGHRFSNGLRWPNDEDGEPGNVINCRCIVMPTQ
jgi:HK97 family phage portal protein